MILLDGKGTAASLRQELAGEIAALAVVARRAPGLAVILVGDDPASQVYVRKKERACQEAGVFSETIRPAASIKQEALLDIIDGQIKKAHCYPPLTKTGLLESYQKIPFWCRY